MTQPLFTRGMIGGDGLLLSHYSRTILLGYSSPSADAFMIDLFLWVFCSVYIYAV
jgi:hypothetical protein